MYMPGLKDAEKIAASGEFKIIPVSREMYSDIITPMEVLRILKNVSRNCYMLESIEDSQQWGRYTFLGFDPMLALSCANGAVTISSGTTFSIQSDRPEEIIRQIIAEYKSPHIDGLPPFTGGLVGYFAYDYIKYSEPTLKLNAKDSGHFKDVDLMLFDKVICFDNFRQKIILIANAKTDSLETEYNKAVMELEKLASLILGGNPAENVPVRMKTSFTPQFSKDEFCAMVKRAKDYIREGDIFQAVLSNWMQAEMDGSLLDAYRVLRTTNPSPYMFYISSDELEIAGASPETLVRLENGRLYTFPLAGTRPRGKTAAEDLQYEQELLSDEKELAEHNMLVDLGRNDIGRIAQIGTVKVEKYLSIERFSHVMHIGSTVSGQIKKDKDALDAVAAILPAGTLSGAPKIRACEIINELEDNKRGIYGGAIGYIDFAGNLDTCIAIRFAYKKNGKVFVQTGAGIVADSIPENEYQECINKAKAVLHAIETAAGGI
ncbi:MAG: anthranilate synthase component I [Christensenellales bacterium]